MIFHDLGYGDAIGYDEIIPENELVTKWGSNAN